MASRFPEKEATSCSSQSNTSDEIQDASHSSGSNAEDEVETASRWSNATYEIQASPHPSDAPDETILSRFLREGQRRYENDQLLMQIEALKDECHQKLNALERTLKSNNLRIYGVQEESEEDVVQVVLDIFKRILQLDVQLSDLSSCHRVGVRSKTFRRPIVITFTSNSAKKKVLKRKHCLRGKGLVICEDLIPGELKLIEDVIDSFGINNVTFENGRIAAVLPNHKRLAFNSFVDFEDYILNKRFSRMLPRSNEA